MWRFGVGISTPWEQFGCFGIIFGALGVPNVCAVEALWEPWVLASLEQFSHLGADKNVGIFWPIFALREQLKRIGTLGNNLGNLGSLGAYIVAYPAAPGSCVFLIRNDPEPGSGMGKYPELRSGILDEHSRSFFLFYVFWVKNT
jgi:hypothetical protein